MYLEYAPCKTKMQKVLQPFYFLCITGMVTTATWKTDAKGKSMQLLPMGSSGDGFRWRAVPGDGEEVNPQEIRKIFVRTCPGHSIEIENLRNGSYILTFPDGVDPTKRAALFQKIITSGYVAA